MSVANYNRGLDDAANGEEYNFKYDDDLDYIAGYMAGDRDNYEDQRGLPEPDYYQAELEANCAESGHPFVGTDDQGPRCHCGQRREFKPEEIE